VKTYFNSECSGFFRLSSALPELGSIEPALGQVVVTTLPHLALMLGRLIIVELGLIG
jgi:hypothetical protein